MRKQTPKLKVLVPDGDHSLRLAPLVLKKVVCHEPSKTWSEYAGEEYLAEGERVVEVYVVE